MIRTSLHSHSETYWPLNLRVNLKTMSRRKPQQMALTSGRRSTKEMALSLCELLQMAGLVAQFHPCLEAVEESLI